MDRQHTTKYRMTDSRRDDFVPGTPAERIGLVWPLTLEVISLSKRYDAKQKTTKTCYKRYTTKRLDTFSLEHMQWLSTVSYATMDIDIPVLPEAENAEAVVRALRRFGTLLQNLT